MKIKVRIKIGIKLINEISDFKKDIYKYVECDVRDADCKKRKCLQVGQFQHRGAVGGGATKDSGTDNFYSCMFRNYHGCPPESYEPIKKEIIKEKN